MIKIQLQTTQEINFPDLDNHYFIFKVTGVTPLDCKNTGVHVQNVFTKRGVFVINFCDIGIGWI